ncbi:MAG: purine-nucleoside phosphorylase [Bacteroidaceae bacterium]
MLEKIQETAAWIKRRLKAQPRTAIVLGTGLGKLASEIEVEIAIPYSDIPNFPVSTVEGHKGRLIVGTLGGVEIMALEGRFHYYEGYTMKEVTFPIRVFAELGIDMLLVSNAAGGTNPDFRVGDIMIITDHLNFMPEHPLRGANMPYGPRFLDMGEAYDHQLIARALQIAEEKGIAVKQGVYLANSGPTYETPAEYRMYKTFGADAVGMSTVPEIIVARHCGMRCFGISIITDMGIGDKLEKVSHKAVQEAANAVQPLMTKIFKGLVLSPN